MFRLICDNDGNELLIIERKSVADLASSIIDGRYAEQSFRLDACEHPNHNIIYLIEGSVANYKSYSRINSKTIYSAMFTLNYYKGFSVIKTIDMTETAEYILRMCDKLNREKKKVSYYETGEILKPKNYSEVVKKVKKENITPENIGEIILSQIPGVSSHTSQIIMNKFGSLYNLLCALDTNQQCMDTLTFITDSGIERRISKTSIRNIVQYLLYQKSNVIVIDTN